MIPQEAIERHHADLRGIAAKRHDADKFSFGLAEYLTSHRKQLAQDAQRTTSFLPDGVGNKRPVVVHVDALQAWLPTHTKALTVWSSPKLITDQDHDEQALRKEAAKCAAA